MRLGKIWIYFINRNYKKRKEGERRERTGSILRHGEALLEIGRLRFRWSWNLWANFCGWEITTGGEEYNLHLHMALPPVSFWLSVDGIIPRPRMDDDARYAGRRDDKSGMEAFHTWYSRQPGERQTGIRIFDWAIWFDFWQKTMEGSNRDKWYRTFAFHPIDFLLGRYKYSEKPLYEEDVEVQMPEKTYQGHVKIYESSWKRPLWPFTKRMVRSSIKVPEGLPHAGKGESGYDCGDDAIYAQHGPAKTPKDAVESIIKSVMSNRKKYGNASFLRNVKT